MHTNSPSAGANARALSARPKADVRIAWHWDAVYADIRQKVSDESRDMQMELNPQGLQVELLQKIIATLFEYTTGVSRAVLVSCEVKIARYDQATGAHLRELNSETDQLLLQVCLHSRIVLLLRISLAPVHALVRSRQELLNAMADVKKLFTEVVKKPEDSHTRNARLRTEKRKQAIVDALKHAPRATPGDIVLLVIDGIVKTGITHRLSVSRSAVGELLRSQRPKTFSTQEKVDEICAGLVSCGWIEQRVSSDNHGSLRILEKGYERLAALVK